MKVIRVEIESRSECPYYVEVQSAQCGYCKKDSKPVRGDPETICDGCNLEDSDSFVPSRRKRR